MKYCLTSRQSASVLKEADQINIPAKDIKLFDKLYEQFPDKTFIITYTKELTDEMKQELAALPPNVIFRVFSLTSLSFLIENGFRAFLGYPPTTLEEAKELIERGVCALVISTPSLFHQIDNIQKLIKICDKEIELRIFPNYIDCWVLPQQLSVYEDNGVSTIEFSDVSSQVERGLFRTYVSGKWSGHMTTLFPNWGAEVDFEAHRVDIERLTNKRLNCGHKCIINECSACHRAYYLAQKIKEIDRK